jgi:hypothetical protein
MKIRFRIRHNLRGTATLRKPYIFLLLFTTVAVASPCHDSRLRSGAVAGDVIRGSVSKNRKPVRLAQVHLYSAGGLVSTCATDEDGMLTIDHLSPGEYQLSIAGWGIVSVEVAPQPKRYHFYDSVILDRRGTEICVAEVSVTN